MNAVLKQAKESIGLLTEWLTEQQKQDGSWRFCFENGIILDAYAIILLRLLEIEDEPLVRKLHARIISRQQANGSWQWYRDETEGNLSASVEAYYALLFSGFSSAEDEAMRKAKAYILSRGGIGMASSILTRAVLAATGQREWPLSISSIPMELLLVPEELPFSLFSFSGYARVHLVPMMIMASRKFSIRNERTPSLSDLHTRETLPDESGLPSHAAMRQAISEGLGRLIGSPSSLRDVASDTAERFLLDRVEADGTLYSYGTSTVLMILALLALGYDKNHPVVAKAWRGFADMRYELEIGTTIQNSPSTIWDTALIAYGLQQAGISPRHDAVKRACDYLLSKQHTRKGDWSKHNPNAEPGGWGFSETNTINPDVDDTTAALRAIYLLSNVDSTYRKSWERGLQWVLSMQNRDGGWPAFEKGVNNEMLTWLSIEGAESAAIDPSTADLTGRTLHFLGDFAKLDADHKAMKRGTEWLIRNQEKNGSWYGRWGISYLYGTWAAITGLIAAGVPADHDTVRKGTEWLRRMQQSDGGWGESCRSDASGRYVSIGASTPSQTAWVLDALIAASPRPTAQIDKGILRLLDFMSENSWKTEYPTGAGLPGYFYIHYHSYRYIWPLLTLARYIDKYDS